MNSKVKVYLMLLPQRAYRDIKRFFSFNKEKKINSGGVNSKFVQKKKNKTVFAGIARVDCTDS